MKKVQYSRRQFTSELLGGAICIGLSPVLFAQQTLVSESEIDWYDVKEIGVEGKAWTDTLRYFDRLPAKARTMVREPVWNLSRHSAGMCMRFVSDSSNIYVRYSLYLERLAMSHMPATGVSGLDLYAGDDIGVDRWVGVVRPEKQEIETSIAKNLGSGSRQYTLYLPLFNGLDSLEVGVLKGESFEPLAPRKEKPILFYGTSIMHGACASRPGMAFPSILGRRLRRPTINLGFSGNGRMEGEVANLLAELDPSLYVIDCLPNMNEITISERAVPLVKKLREANNKTPILLVEDRNFTNTSFFPHRKSHHQKSRAALKKAYAELSDAGVGNLYYMDGDHLLGNDGEAATDGSHPSDLGMVRYADAYEPVLRSILKQF